MAIFTLLMIPVLFVLNIIWNVLKTAFGLLVAVLSPVLGAVFAVWLFVNLVGVVVGFEYVSSFCDGYHAKTQSRIEKSIVAAPIACSVKGGKFRPAMFVAYEWLTARPTVKK